MLLDEHHFEKQNEEYLKTIQNQLELLNSHIYFQYDEYNETNGPIRLHLSGKQQRDVSDDRSVR